MEDFRKRQFVMRVQRIVPILLVIMSVCVLALPFYQWGFVTDDFGLVWHGRVKSIFQLGQFFSEKGLHTFMQPANYVAPDQTFFAVLYRPFLYAFYGLQYLIFGFNACGFLIVSALFHGTNAVLLLAIFRRYFQGIIPVLGAFYFLFHHSLLHWFGWATAQQHILALFFMLLAAYAYQRYQETKFFIWPLISLLSITGSLLTRETALVVPCVLILTYLFWYKEMQSKILWGVVGTLPIAMYVGWRVVQFPLMSSEEIVPGLQKGHWHFFNFLRISFLTM